MDTYILRIYRRSPDEPGAVHGTLERVGVRERVAFGSCSELWALLMASSRPDEASSGAPGTGKSDR